MKQVATGKPNHKRFLLHLSIQSFCLETSKSTDAPSKRRMLQEQPPPPKLWDSHKKPEKVLTNRTAASIRGHTAIPSQTKMNKPQDTLQQKLDEVLNSPGTAVDGDVTMHLKVSDVDPPIQSVSKSIINSSAANSSSNSLPAVITSSSIPSSARESSNISLSKSSNEPPTVSASAENPPNVKDVKVLNHEVEAITKGKYQNLL